MKPDDVHPRFGITQIQVSGFRTARDVSPGQLCALVGEADAGKSNLLAAIRAVLDPTAATLTVADTAEGGDGNISIRVELASGGEASLEGNPAHDVVLEQDAASRLLFLPAEARAGAVLTGANARAEGSGEVIEIFQRALEGRRRGSAGRALSLVDGLEEPHAARSSSPVSPCSSKD